VGKIVQHEKLADGRFNLVLHGEAKVMIEGFEREAPYRIARLRSVEDDTGWLTTATVGEDAANLVRLFGRSHAAGGMASALAEMLGAHMSPEAILNTVAMNLGVEAEIKERLLAVESLGARYRAVVRILEEASTTQEGIDRFRHLLPPDSRQN
jgi:Lon protease-like protein